mmetsp:Transcript_1551/g.3838  ORF Transcript_1551/g.3838 Transcript_1551/m.3838 type:complete len:201 (+) Transcript_1551:228-830(+)
MPPTREVPSSQGTTLMTRQSGQMTKSASGTHCNVVPQHIQGTKAAVPAWTARSVSSAPRTSIHCPGATSMLWRGSLGCCVGLGCGVLGGRLFRCACAWAREGKCACLGVAGFFWAWSVAEPLLPNRVTGARFWYKKAFPLPSSFSFFLSFFSSTFDSSSLRSWKFASRDVGSPRCAGGLAGGLAGGSVRGRGALCTANGK